MPTHYAEDLFVAKMRAIAEISPMFASIYNLTVSTEEVSAAIDSGRANLYARLSAVK